MKLEQWKTQRLKNCKKREKKSWSLRKIIKKRQRIQSEIYETT